MTDIMTTLFLLLPVFMFGGIALQATGLYLFGIILPMILGNWSSNPPGQDQPIRIARTANLSDSTTSHELELTWGQTLSRVGTLLALAWLVFPLCNFIGLLDLDARLESLNSVSGQDTPSLGLSWSQLFTSKLASTLLASALSCLAIGQRLNKNAVISTRTQNPARDSDQVQRLSQAFFRGMAFATIAFGVYFSFQHLTGFDHRFPGNHVGEDRLLRWPGLQGTNFYRICGLYGHPLSMAAVALALLSFCLALLAANCRSITCTKDLPSWLLKRQARPGLMVLALAQFGFLAMSGGRTAMLVGALFTACFAFQVIRHHRGWLQSLLWTVCLTGLSVIAILRTGMFSRFTEAIRVLKGGVGPAMDRLSFWQVHWNLFLDRPFFGSGPAWLSAGLRRHAYDTMGFSQLQDKYNAHNIFLECLASIGIVGSCVLVGSVLWSLQILGVKISKSTPTCQLLWTALQWSLLANLLHGLTQNTFFDASLMAVYLVLAWFVGWLAWLNDHSQDAPIHHKSVKEGLALGGCTADHGHHSKL